MATKRNKNGVCITNYVYETRVCFAYFAFYYTIEFTVNKWETGNRRSINTFGGGKIYAKFNLFICVCVCVSLCEFNKLSY